MAIAWIPRASAPAVLGSVIYNDAKAKGAGYEHEIEVGL